MSRRCGRTSRPGFTARGTTLRCIAVLKDALEQLLRTTVNEFADRAPERLVGERLASDFLRNLVDRHAGGSDKSLTDPFFNNTFAQSVPRHARTLARLGRRPKAMADSPASIMDRHCKGARVCSVSSSAGCPASGRAPTELLLGRIGHHRRAPRRIPDHIDLHRCGAGSELTDCRLRRLCQVRV